MMTQSERDLYLSQCSVQRISSYGSHPWAIVHGPTGTHVSGPPEMLDVAGIGRCLIDGRKYYPRKRDAQAVLDALNLKEKASK